MAFAVEVFKFVRPMFQAVDMQRVAGQLHDAASSVAANYRASSHARSSKEWRAKLGVVVEESDESLFWLLFIKRTGLRDDDKSTLTRLTDEADQLTRIFSAALRTSRDKAGHRPR